MTEPNDIILATLSAGLSGGFWEAANHSHKNHVRILRRAFSFIFATLALGFLVLSFAPLFTKH